MGKEYIEREAAIDALTERNLVVHMDSVNDGLVASCHRSAQRVIANIPAADVRPVVRGKWIQTTQPMGWRDEDCAECSVCGEDFVLDEWAMDEFTNLMNFCPNCGADMREEG